MSTNLYNTPILVEDDDLVSGRDRIKLVCNNDESRVTTQFIHSGGHTVFVLGIEGTGGLVEKNNGRVFQERSRDGYALAFAAGERTAALADWSIPPQR